MVLSFSFFQLKLVSMMEKVIIIERKMPDLVERTRMEAVEQTLLEIQQRLPQLEQRLQREQQQQSSSVGVGGGGTVGTTRVGRYGTVENMAGWWGSLGDPEGRVNVTRRSRVKQIFQVHIARSTLLLVFFSAHYRLISRRS